MSLSIDNRIDNLIIIKKTKQLFRDFFWDIFIYYQLVGFPAFAIVSKLHLMSSRHPRLQSGLAEVDQQTTWACHQFGEDQTLRFEPSKMLRYKALRTTQLRIQQPVKSNIFYYNWNFIIFKIIKIFICV